MSLFKIDWNDAHILKTNTTTISTSDCKLP